MSIRRLSTSTLTEQTRYATMSTGTATPITPSSPLLIPYVVIAGGGGGGGSVGGGGGAGGYRTSYSTDLSGAQSATESPLSLTGPATLDVAIGAGGGVYASGSSSTLHTITCVGGGRGSQYRGSAQSGGSGGGGSGGGDGDPGDNGASGTAAQGTNGGNSQHSSGTNRRSGGGGGAWVQGGNASGSVAGDGGQGAISTMLSEALATAFNVGDISGGNVYFAGGGGGEAAGGTQGDGGLGGGGDRNQDGGLNTGGGGGDSGSGGAGLIMFRIPSIRTVEFSEGVTLKVIEDGFDTIYVITATSTGSETVTIS